MNKKIDMKKSQISPTPNLSWLITNAAFRKLVNRKLCTYTFLLLYNL